MKSKTPCSTVTAEIIRKLREELKDAYGCDFSYSIVARGQLVAASNARDGHIEPLTVKEYLGK